MPGPRGQEWRGLSKLHSTQEISEKSLDGPVHMQHAGELARVGPQVGSLGGVGVSMGYQSNMYVMYCVLMCVSYHKITYDPYRDAGRRSNTNVINAHGMAPPLAHIPSHSIPSAFYGNPPLTCVAFPPYVNSSISQASLGMSSGASRTLQMHLLFPATGQSARACTANQRPPIKLQHPAWQLGQCVAGRRMVAPLAASGRGASCAYCTA